MNADAWKKSLLLHLPYGVIGLAAAKLSEAWRLTPGVDFSEKLLNIGNGFAQAFAVPLPSFHPTDLCIGLMLGAVLRLAVHLKGKNAKKYRKNTEYGSARCRREPQRRNCCSDSAFSASR